MIGFQEYDKLHQQIVSEIEPLVSEQARLAISRHCFAWRDFDFVHYLRHSSIRFYHAYQVICQAPDHRTVCDVGGFWGVFPRTLRRLGFTVSMTESLQYYHGCFAPILDILLRDGIEVIDLDPFSDMSELQRQFDVLTVMAVVEHYPHSLRTFMMNLRRMMAANARIMIEVPNIARWPNRLALLRGRSPLPAIGDIFRSEVPFIGHHHEFTRQELRDLLQLSGLLLVDEVSYGYSHHGGIRDYLRHPLSTLVTACFPSTREVIAAVGRLDPSFEPLIEAASS